MEKEGFLDTPADISIFDDKIFVVEERNHRVSVFTLDGRFINKFGSYGKVFQSVRKTIFAE